VKCVVARWRLERTHLLLLIRVSLDISLGCVCFYQRHPSGLQRGTCCVRQQRNVLGVICEEPTLGVCIETFLHMRFAVAVQKSGEQIYERI
jgi:hypothetical protein